MSSNATYGLITMPAKYHIYKDVERKFRFRLQAENNEIVAVSEAYEQHASCINGVKSMQKNCSADIEDMTTEGERISNPKYQIFYDKERGYRFHLNARNGEIIAASEGYKSKEGCLKGIQAIKDSCTAEIEDTTCKEETVSTKRETPTEEPDHIKNAIPANAVRGGNTKAPEKSGVVFIGNKMPMDYVLAIITGLSSSTAKGITLKARGKSITVAVDAAEITRRRFLKDLKIRKIAIGTEEMPPRQGETRARMVSTIEIVLEK
ncbi:TPA: DNA-binding protein Alba [Candidatus Bathyarchaeota archaeon]|nr:DNA-binding protein Alba [Candidatus Bathyarchaeota archaeon]HIJ08709.1 DNA-binding protein Alba [Candidatus Bathyarchaeota archaeon]